MMILLLKKGIRPRHRILVSLAIIITTLLYGFKLIQPLSFQWFLVAAITYYDVFTLCLLLLYLLQIHHRLAPDSEQVRLSIIMKYGCEWHISSNVYYV